MKRILIVEDDNAINELLYDLLNEQYDVTQAYAGSEAKRLTETESFDLILLDLMLPGISGEAFIEAFRRTSEVPIIVLTAKAEVDVLANVLSIGANDYVSKPFNTIEVQARVKAQLRDHKEFFEKTEVHRRGPIELDEAARVVKVNGSEVTLTQKEFDMLKSFLLHPQKVFTKANLFESVWHEPYFGDDNTISVHISRLRSKLSQYNEEELIETIWGVGFKLKQF
ncbi:response regulator transcription factor [Marinilactibacillus piezotolerans]|uniref:response regulator transcription factor n=1 Tax=Marinilactibacillus piezotolerans TaxID=258723 RepID=UPI0009B05345|nr:response regulator transcription factor [Marinilactibacillus piezotolerans]